MSVTKRNAIFTFAIFTFSWEQRKLRYLFGLFARKFETRSWEAWFLLSSVAQILVVAVQKTRLILEHNKFLKYIKGTRLFHRHWQSKFVRWRKQRVLAFGEMTEYGPHRLVLSKIMGTDVERIQTFCALKYCRSYHNSYLRVGFIFCACVCAPIYLLRHQRWCAKKWKIDNNNISFRPA